MLARQTLAADARGRRDFTGGSIGWLGDPALPAQNSFLLFTGLPINGPDVTSIHNADDACRRLPDLDGAFVMVYWDDSARTLVLVTDFLGLQPIYLRRDGRNIELATETKAFAATPDPAGWGSFIAMGHTIGKQTLLSGVFRLPPATVLTYAADSGALRISRYWVWPQGTHAVEQGVVKALQASAIEYQRIGGPATLMLSGGFDSRLLLYALKGINIRPNALIISHQDLGRDTDGRLAQSLARREHLETRFVTPPSDFFSSADFLSFVDACDAAIPTMNLFIAKLLAYAPSGPIWDGLIPGFALRLVFEPGGGFARYVRQHCREWNHPDWKAARILFGDTRARDMYIGFEALLNEAVSQFNDNDTGIFHFVAENRIRHRTSSHPLKVLSQRALPYIPGMTKAFFALISDLPRHTATPNGFYLHIFEKFFPHALELPLLKGNEILRANGSLREVWRHQAIEALDRFLGHHPSLNPSRYLRHTGPTDSPGHSKFLFKDDTLLEPDDWLDIAAARAIGPSHPLFMRVRLLLFHWKAWRWVHDRRLLRSLAEGGQ